jgi:hypothetical protein
MSRPSSSAARRIESTSVTSAVRFHGERCAKVPAPRQPLGHVQQCEARARTSRSGVRTSLRERPARPASVRPSMLTSSARSRAPSGAPPPRPQPCESRSGSTRVAGPRILSSRVRIPSAASLDWALRSLAVAVRSLRSRGAIASLGPNSVPDLGPRVGGERLLDRAAERERLAGSAARSSALGEPAW